MPTDRAEHGDEPAIEQLFIEQAEYLEPATFRRWHIEHPNEKLILRKLTQGGAKLISGPRGSGKTTLMLKAYYAMLESSDMAFPVYVNYKRSLSIEPIYKSGTSGTYWFNQWVLLKLYQGIYSTLEGLGDTSQLSVTSSDANRAASRLEMSSASEVELPELTVLQLACDIERVIKRNNRSRCVLLLDDAAHAFSPEQQRDFFDFFRQIKSQFIFPKAAVYPGVTNYSSSFHVGHDAEQIDVWIKPEGDQYLEFMRSLVRSRFPAENFSSPGAIELVDFLSYAAFGVPRSLLNMLQEITKEDSGGTRLRLSRAEALRAAKQHFSAAKKLFASLSDKLPVYESFIKTGDLILVNALNLIKAYNKGKQQHEQSVSIAVSEEDLSHELSKVFAFFQYAGLCIAKEEAVSRGEKGRFRIFFLHYAGLIDANALFGARSININEYVSAFNTRNAHEFTRTSPKKLIGNARQDAFSLSLPPCSVCNTPRVHEGARFCTNCGSPLKAPSTYEALMNADIDKLPLTPARISKIKAQSPIKKIKDIILDAEHKHLLAVDRVGEYWAARIVRLAEEFVE